MKEAVCRIRFGSIRKAVNKMQGSPTAAAAGPFLEPAILPATFNEDGSIQCRLVIFDLDGTIVDSGPGIKNSISKAIGKMGLPAKSEDELNSFIGPPLRVSFQKEFGLTTDKAEEVLHCYRMFYYQQGIYEAMVYDGIPELLRELRDKGYLLAVGTSKPWVLAHRVLSYFGLRQYFDTVFGCYIDGRLDSKALVLQALVEHYSGKKLLSAGRQRGQKDRASSLSGSPAAAGTGMKAVMIGDRFYDVVGAKTWALPTIGVAYGYGTAQELQEAGAALVVNHPKEIGARL